MKNTSISSNKEIVYTNNFFFYLNLIRSIKKAKYSIDISLYIFELDRIGRLILKLLLDASKNGIHVNLVLDGVGSLNSYAKIDLDSTNYPNFNIILFNPLPWPFSKQNLARHIQNRTLFPLFGKLNSRNHSKFFIFDKKTVYLGSHNIFDQSRLWRETSIKIETSDIAESCNLVMNWLLENSFVLRKSIKKKLRQDFKTSAKLYFSHSIITHRLFRKKLIEQITKSKNHIQIIIPYFFPPLSLVRSLVNASKRGVLVEIILPRVTDIFLFPRISRLFYRSLIEGGVHIYEYSNGMIHAKQFRIDDWVVVGSSNLTSRSLFRDVEVDYALQEKQSIKKIICTFENDKMNSNKILKSNVSFRHRLFNQFLAKFFGFWI